MLDRVEVGQDARARDGEEHAEHGAAAARATTPSVSIWPSRRPRPAPSAVRIAISFCRAAVRASSRFERLAQTISITTPTAPASTRSASRSVPLTCSASGVTRPSKLLRSRMRRARSAAPASRASACALAAGDAGLQPADHRHRVAPAVGLGAEREREVEIEVAAGREDRREVERRRQHADHGVPARR